MESLVSSGVIGELRSLEPIFHRSPAGTPRVVFEAMTTEDYWEVGASGRVYSRKQVLDIVAARYTSGDIDPAGPMSVSAFAVQNVGESVFLVTYMLKQLGRETRRLTVWTRSSGTWKAAYHQGTVMT